MSAKPHKIIHYKVRLIRAGFDYYPIKKIMHSHDAKLLFTTMFKDLPHEEMAVIYINARNYILGTATVSMGGLHGASLTPADIFRGAIDACASSIILGHNHPSGSLAPSEEDIELTRKARQAGKLLGIEVQDHLIICGSECVSVELEED